MKINASVLKSWFWTLAFVLCMVSVVAAIGDADSQIASVMTYIKWIIGIVAGIVTLSAVGTLMWGFHLKNLGDPKGNDMIKNSLMTIVVCAVAWALLGALILKGTALGTGVNKIDEGWK
jgi:lysylphosphatidylglycerol synthetase-like protein (DUF2156 family)